MDYFPAFLKMDGKKVLIIGGTEDALHKVRLLRKTSAQLIIFGAITDDTLAAWVDTGSIQHTPHQVAEQDLRDAVMAYIGTDDPTIRDAAIALFETVRLPYSVIDDKARSAFITPALVDRDPVVVAIGTEGTGPIIARDIKARIEAELHPLTGLVAKLAGLFRPRVEHLPHGAPRRRFWQRYLDEIVPAIVAASPKDPAEHLQNGLEYLLATHDCTDTHAQPSIAPIRIINVAAGSADLLTRKALTWLHDADMLLYQAATAFEIVELSRRESQKVMYSAQALNHEQTSKMLNAVHGGKSVVVLAGDHMPFDENIVLSAGLEIEHAPYVPAFQNHAKSPHVLRAAS